MKTQITGPREFFLELKSFFNAVGNDIAAGRSSLETKDALARTLSYVNEREMALSRIHPTMLATGTFEINAQDVDALEEARTVLAQVIQGNTDYRSDEARNAVMALLCIMPRLSPTWNGGRAS